jgi:hypothetical protein
MMVPSMGALLNHFCNEQSQGCVNFFKEELANEQAKNDH